MKQQNGRQEWEISDIIGKEVVDGEVHYLVEWRATLVPKSELGKAKVLGKFGKRQGRRPPPKAGKQAIATQQKKGRGRPRTQV
jgi:hypothetical protein